MGPRSVGRHPVHSGERSEFKVSGVKARLPSRIESVAFACDPFRLGRTADGLAQTQVANLHWVREIVSASSPWRAKDLTVELVHPPTFGDALQRAIGDEGVLRQYRQAPEEAWAARFDRRPLDAFVRLPARLAEFDLVVGFELPPGLRRELAARRVPYINFYIHPLRFLRDLCFAVTTNCPGIDALLRRYVVPSSEVLAQLHRFRAMFRRADSPAFSMPAGAPVLIGQTERDSVLIRDGRFSRWSDHLELLVERLRGHDAVVLLEHPLRTSSCDIARFLRVRVGKTVVSTNANGYGVLMSNEAIPFAVTLSSSLGVEAMAMGIETDFLLDDPRELIRIPEIENSCADALGHGVLLEGFWGALLGRAADDRPGPRGDLPKAEPFALGANYVRSSLESWSYGLLEAGAATARSRKALVPGWRLDDQDRESLESCLLSPPSLSRRPEVCAPAGATHPAVEVVRGPACIGPNEGRSFDLSEPWEAVSLDGFHAAEAWGIWMAEPIATIRIACSEAAISQRARLQVTLQVLASSLIADQCPVLRVEADQQHPVYVFFGAGPRASASISVGVDIKGPVCEIGLEFPFLFRPVDQSGTQDERLLGCALTGLAVECSVPSRRSSGKEAPAGIGSRPNPRRRSAGHRPGKVEVVS